MSFTAPSRPAQVPSAGQPLAAPGPLLGMYALVFTVLGCIGAFAGEIFFLDDRAVSAGYDRAIARCLQHPGLNPQLTIPVLDRCVASSYRLEGLVVVAVAVAVPTL